MLDTQVHVLDPVDPQQVFQACCTLVGVTEQHLVEDEEAFYEAEPESGVRELRTKPNQGLPAWVHVYYRPGAPLRAEGQCVTATVEESFAPCHLAATFSSNGGTVEQHVDLLTRLASWLDERSLRWSWCGNAHAAAVSEAISSNRG